MNSARLRSDPIDFARSAAAIRMGSTASASPAISTPLIAEKEMAVVTRSKGSGGVGFSGLAGTKAIHQAQSHKEGLRSALTGLHAASLPSTQPCPYSPPYLSMNPSFRRLSQ